MLLFVKNIMYSNSFSISSFSDLTDFVVKMYILLWCVCIFISHLGLVICCLMDFIKVLTLEDRMYSALVFNVLQYSITPFKICMYFLTEAVMK